MNYVEIEKSREERLEQLFEELVPASGKADSLAGEIVRAVMRIGYRYFNDGDQIGIGYGKETCNSAARFLLTYVQDHEIVKVVRAMWGCYSELMYSMALNELVGMVNKYVDEHPELRETETVDMWDLYDKREDVDDSWEEDDEDDEYDEDEGEYE